MTQTKQDQKGLTKNTSLQGWSKLTETYFHHKLRIEDRKDREQIYNLLKKLGLPYERFVAFPSGDKISKTAFTQAVAGLGFPYWISVTPKLGITDLNRISKLHLENIEDGWNFLTSLDRLADFKVIVMQYADEPEFKGTVIVSQNLNGIADFVTGDRHYQLISGLTISDPMLFNSQKIIHYSETISHEYQDLLYSYVSNHPGHFEFQYGILDKEKGLSFFDYNDEVAYENIDALFDDLVIYHDLTPPKAVGKLSVAGIPACLGQAEGVCRVLLSSDYTHFDSVQKGEILITDTTTPDMTPIMARVSAIVTDLGGVTSHAAIVCRELQIPCIVCTKKGTTTFKTGQKIKVDAFRGLAETVN